MTKRTRNSPTRAVSAPAPPAPASAASRRGTQPHVPPRATRIGSTSPPSRWRRMPQERHAHILNAALDAFVENGFAATRLEDIAERAGVAKGTLYLYFE